MQDRANNPTASVHLYEKYVRLYPTPYNFQAEAHYKLLALYLDMNNKPQETQQMQALVATWQAAGSKADARVKIGSRRVGKEGVSPCRFCWSQEHLKNKKKIK